MRIISSSNGVQFELRNFHGNVSVDITADESDGIKHWYLYRDSVVRLISVLGNLSDIGDPSYVYSGRSSSDYMRIVKLQDRATIEFIRVHSVGTLSSFKESTTYQVDPNFIGAFRKALNEVIMGEENATTD